VFASSRSPEDRQKRWGGPTTCGHGAVDWRSFDAKGNSGFRWGGDRHAYGAYVLHGSGWGRPGLAFAQTPHSVVPRPQPCGAIGGSRGLNRDSEAPRTRRQRPFGTRVRFGGSWRQAGQIASTRAPPGGHARFGVPGEVRGRDRRAGLRDEALGPLRSVMSDFRAASKRFRALKCSRWRNSANLMEVAFSVV
jgi:hypothetical protein